MTRATLLRIAILLGVLALGWWILESTEWKQVEVDVPLEGEAQRDPHYGLKRFLGELHVPLEVHSSLDALPPVGTRLLLTSNHWDMFQGRSQRLHDWVRAGGHLVLPARAMTSGDVEEWLPVKARDFRKGERDQPPGALKVVPPAGRASAPAANDDDDDEDEQPVRRPPEPPRGCRPLQEWRGAEPTRTLQVCAWPFFRQLLPEEPGRAAWQLRDARQVHALRLPLGAGSVSVYGSWDLLSTKKVIERDNPLAIAALLQLDTGAPVWIVAEESREKLVPWLWHQAWIVIVAALAAFAAAAWRAWVRFGPAQADPPNARRSMREQVVGVARFLHRHHPGTLHAAQQRALLEAAHRHLPGTRGAALDALAPAIAAATGLDAAELAAALRPPANPRDMPRALQLLETARRRLAGSRDTEIP